MGEPSPNIFSSLVLLVPVRRGDLSHALGAPHCQMVEHMGLPEQPDGRGCVVPWMHTSCGYGVTGYLRHPRRNTYTCVSDSVLLGVPGKAT